MKYAPAIKKGIAATPAEMKLWIGVFYIFSMFRPDNIGCHGIIFLDQMAKAIVMIGGITESQAFCISFLKQSDIKKVFLLTAQYYFQSLFFSCICEGFICLHDLVQFKMMRDKFLGINFFGLYCF